MDYDPSFPDSQSTLELRVLSGPQAGARAALDPGNVCMLAAGPDDEGADIMLRENRETPVRVRMVAGRDMAMIEVLDGPVMMGEQSVAAGESTAWAMHTPLKVGDSIVAFGLAGDEAWPSGGGVATSVAPAGDIEKAGAEPPLLPPRRKQMPWLAAACVVVALLGAGGLGLAYFLSQGTPLAAPIPFAEALRATEFAGLAVAADASGRPELRGRLATLAQKAKLDAWLAARRFSPIMNVFVDEAVSRDVTEVFRVNGVAVQARVQDPGHIVAVSAERDEERLARASEVVRRDVRGLARLSLANKAPPAPPVPPPPVVDDPGKRIASIVPGNPAYIVTVDGARYFVGAMLPTGHRITAIAGQRVSLERDGEAIALNL